MLSALSNDQIVFLGLAAQFACAVGVWFAGRWGALFAYLLTLPIFWILSFGLASGHVHVALDGIIVLPVIFLACVCYSAYRRAEELAEANELGATSPPGKQ